MRRTFSIYCNNSKDKFGTKKNLEQLVKSKPRFLDPIKRVDTIKLEHTDDSTWVKLNKNH